jgi:transposase
MGTVPVFVGLDYHAGSIQVCIVDQKGKQISNRRCGNSLAEVLAVVNGHGLPAQAAVESCCGAADLAEQLRDQAGWPISLAHPGYVSRMKHNPDKSDFSDARMLAELCRVGMVPKVWLAPSNIRDLRMLIRLRADLVARVRTVKTRILGTLRAQRIIEPTDRGGRWTRKWLAWLAGSPDLSEDAAFIVRMHLDEFKDLRRRIATVEARLEAKTKDDAVVQRLLTVDGVGPVTAWTMRALIGRFDRFTSGKELARFCAVTPRNASSGQRMADAGLVRAGDPLLKTVLIQAAHRLRRRDTRWKAFSDQLKGRGKPVSVIVAAIANRWVRAMYHQLKEIPQTEMAQAA